MGLAGFGFGFTAGFSAGFEANTPVEAFFPFEFTAAAASARLRSCP